MGWGVGLFALLLSGFGIVYLIWPEGPIPAYYGLAAANVALILSAASLTLTHASLRSPPGVWTHRIWLGFSAGLWFWMVAGIKW